MNSTDPRNHYREMHGIAFAMALWIVAILLGACQLGYGQAALIGLLSWLTFGAGALFSSGDRLLVAVRDNGRPILSIPVFVLAWPVMLVDAPRARVLSVVRSFDTKATDARGDRHER